MKKMMIAGFVLLMLVGVFLLYNGYIWFNSPSFTEYPIQGLDVSHHQGEIDWATVGRGLYRFVYIKATEGRDFTDASFVENWQGAAREGLIHGAYHFFTFGSAGGEQAEHFIRTVPREEGMLPPVIDLEFDGNSKKIPEREYLQGELRVFMVEIEEHYGQKPIIYTTYAAYEQFLRGDFAECKIWIRDILKAPKLEDGREWTFWQFSNRGRVDGIKGYVDKNVFVGGSDGLNDFLLKKE